MAKPNFDFRPGCGRRHRSTKPTRARYVENVGEHDFGSSEQREMIELVSSRLDQDSRDLLSADVTPTEEKAFLSETTAEQRGVMQQPDLVIRPEPEVMIPVRVEISPGVTFTPAPNSKLGKRLLSKRTMQQRLSREQRLIYKFARAIHPKLGNKTVDAAAAEMGIPRDVGRAWHLILRNVLGEAEWAKSDITVAREAKDGYERELLRRIVALPGPRCEAPKRKRTPVGKRDVARSYVTQSQQRVPRAQTYPRDGMDHF